MKKAVSAGAILAALLLGASLQAMAQEHGVSEDEVARTVAGHLPDVIDHLSPDGKLPEETARAGGRRA